MKISELLDETKHALGIDSDGELARKLGLDKRRVSEYYKGINAPNEFVCLQIAQATGKSLETVIAIVRAEAEKDENRRKAWESYMKSLGGIAAGIVGIVTTIPLVQEVIQLALLSA